MAKETPPGWIKDENGDIRPPSIGPAPTEGEKKGAAPEESAVEKNRKPLAQGDEALAQNLANLTGMSIEEARATIQGGGGGDLLGEQEDPLETALTEAALEVSGIDLYSYNESGQLPGWVPMGLRRYMKQPDEPLRGMYDPYYGFMDQQGDERVYMGERDWQESNKKFAKRQEDKIADDARQGRIADAMGDPTEVTSDDPALKRRKGKRDKVLSYAQAVNLPYSWDDDEVAANMARFREAGINVRNFEELNQAWGALVDRASKTYVQSLGERKVTPWDVLEMQKREQAAAGSLVDYENGTQTRTATSVHEISEGAAWATLRTTLSSLLGRDPSDQEVRDFSFRMNTLAAKNPTITETITRYQAGEAVSSESKTTGGFEADDMARAAYEQAQDAPEYAKVQAGTTYYNALLSAIGAVGDV